MDTCCIWADDCVGGMPLERYLRVFEGRANIVLKSRRQTPGSRDEFIPSYSNIIITYLLPAHT